jgi:hypothetical protein
VSLAVDFPHQDFLGTQDGDCGNLPAQLFACAIAFLFDLGARHGQLPFALLGAVCLAVRDDLVGARMRLIQNGGGLLAGFVDNVGRFRLRFLETVPPSIARASRRRTI